jgi:hypothetical protein
MPIGSVLTFRVEILFLAHPRSTYISGDRAPHHEVTVI